MSHLYIRFKKFFWIKYGILTHGRTQDGLYDWLQLIWSTLSYRLYRNKFQFQTIAKIWVHHTLSFGTQFAIYWEFLIFWKSMKHILSKYFQQKDCTKSYFFSSFKRNDFLDFIRIFFIVNIFFLSTIDFWGNVS